MSDDGPHADCDIALFKPADAFLHKTENKRIGPWLFGCTCPAEEAARRTRRCPPELLTPDRFFNNAIPFLADPPVAKLQRIVSRATDQLVRFVRHPHVEIEDLARIDCGDSRCV